MPEADKEGERYSADTPQAAPGFFLKGAHQLDWGMSNAVGRTSPGRLASGCCAVDRSKQQYGMLREQVGDRHIFEQEHAVVTVTVVVDVEVDDRVAAGLLQAREAAIVQL